jgi:MFS family permease
MQAINARETRSVLRIHPATFLFAARALRDIGDGFVAVLLPIYLLALGFTALEVGVIATASLLGSALLTICVGFLGARYDHRQLLLAGASLMIATGVAFAVVHDYALLLVIAVTGTINSSAGSVSVFVPLEDAVLTREVTQRTRIFARYSLVGAFAGAMGGLEPVLVRFDSERPDQTKATGGIGKDAYDIGSAPNFLVEALQHVGALHVFMMPAGQSIEG